jgi:PAS domain S-box-containing protein
MADGPGHAGSRPAGATVPDPGDERLLALLDALPIAASVAMASDQAIVHSNAAWLRLLGFSSMGEARGRTIESMIAPESLRKARRVLEMARETGGYSDDDRRYQLVRADGSLLDVEIAGATAVLGGQPAIVSLLTDMTAEATAVDALAESERFLQRILDTTTNLVYIYDLAQRSNVYANRELTAFLGYTPEQVQALGSGLMAHLLHGDDIALVEEHHARCAHAAHGETLEVEYRMRHADGGWRWLHSRDVPFTYGAEGAVTQILGVCSDVTERRRSEDAAKQAEQALRESEQRLRLSLAATRQGLYDLDLRTDVASVTPEYLAMIGDDPSGERIDLATFGQRIHPDDAAHVLAVVEAYTRGDIDEYREEYRLRHASGAWVWVLSIGRVVERDADGRAVRVLGTHTDITERIRAETELREYKNGLERVVEERTRELTESNRALEEASRAKSQFLASMSHELRTPLNSIIGFTGIMLQGLTGELTAEQRAQLEMVNRAGRQLLGLVSDVLDLARVEAGRVQLELEAVDLAKLATGLTDTVRPMAEDVGLTVDLDLDRAPAILHTDRSKVEQILLNFLSNSVKYTEAGGITLIIEGRDDGSVALSVRDTGVGIAEEDQASIFEEFRQLPATRSAKHPGSGLGLAISIQLAEVIGGRIELKSTLGEGSTFTLVLPETPPA